ncbi:hypothetical protein J108_23555 [Mycobacteroides abscessus subsp. bolletii CRM-0020]|uniref:Uncharacterized protein n=1 Tax=Mycobacteroides abscessus subsp. bolletii CRM-0020 TaxID=1306401 RepID=A0A829HN76_9MYCO|nr:hypothetical protein J108_23555 [Mycobacteroides abscessus subsp. bolletii CRM-0020]
MLLVVLASRRLGVSPVARLGILGAPAGLLLAAFSRVVACRPVDGGNMRAVPRFLVA